jgi:hypothetical protein
MKRQTAKAERCPFQPMSPGSDLLHLLRLTISKHAISHWI